MDGIRLPPNPDPEPARLEHPQHDGVLWQNLGNQFLEPSLARHGYEMVHQSRANAMPLVRVVHREGHLGLAWLHDDIAGFANDHRLSVLIQHGDQGDMAHEVDIEVEVDLLLREAAPEAEEAPVKRLLACSPNGG